MGSIENDIGGNIYTMKSCFRIIFFRNNDFRNSQFLCNLYRKSSKIYLLSMIFFSQFNLNRDKSLIDLLMLIKSS